MTSKRVTALLLATVLLVSAVGGVASVAIADSGDDIVSSHDDESEYNETQPADEAYVTDSGDVVLVYDYDDGASDVTSGHAGVDVSAGLAHFEMQGEEIETDTTGDLTLWASPDEVAMNGSLSTPQPAWLTSLDADLQRVQNETVNQGSMAIDASMSLDGDAGALGMVQQAGTSGFVETTPTSLASNGSANVELAVGVGADRNHHVLLTESDGSYTLSVEESYVLQSPWGQDPTEGWGTRDAARETLRQEYCPSGNCSISIENYALNDGERPRLNLSYTITYDDLDAKLSAAIVDGLTTSRTNTTEAEATELATHVENVTLSRVEANLVSDGRETTASWNVSLEGKDDLTLAYAGFLDVFERSTTGMAGGPEMMGGPYGTSPGELATQLRTQVDASRAANLQQSTQWDLSFATDGDTAQLNGTASSETTNWASYVDELQERDGTVPASTAASIDVGTTGDRVELEGSATVSDDELLQGMLESYNETLSQSGTDTTKLADAMNAIDQAEFTRARMDLSVDDRISYEGAVAVDNATALSSQLPEPYASVEESYTDLDEGQTVVRLNESVDSDADAAAVRSLSLVGEDTEVNLAGTWDRSFESLDVASVENYLGLRTSDSGEDLPIVILAGGGVAVTAAAGGGIVLFRRFG